MNTNNPEPLVQPFPMPSERIRDAVWDLVTFEEGTEDDKESLGPAHELPRPWDVASCTDPDLRKDVWTWYEEFVTWFNHEYVWDPAAGMIPPCWPQHPHLVHEIGVLADQRRVIAIATNSNSLEEWHRIIVPGFLERMHERIRQHCDDHHQPCPTRARYVRHRVDAAARGSSVEADLSAAANRPPRPGADTFAPATRRPLGHTAEPPGTRHVAEDGAQRE